MFCVLFCTTALPKPMAFSCSNSYSTIHAASAAFPSDKNIFFFLSLSSLINKACSAKKRLGANAHRGAQAAPQAPSPPFPPRGWGPRPHSCGPGRAPQTDRQTAAPGARGRPGCRSPPHTVLLPVPSPLTLSCGAACARRGRAPVRPAGDAARG